MNRIPHGSKENENGKESFVFLLKDIKGWNLVPVYIFPLGWIVVGWEKIRDKRMLLLMDFIYGSTKHKTFK